MSELKGMVVFAVSEPCEDGSFFVKKSIRDGSLAIFDEDRDADRQLRRNGIQGNVVNECLLVRVERARNVNDELSSLTETLRLKELENQQLAQDKAELVETLKIATDTLSLFTDDSIDISKRVSSKSIESLCLIDDLLEKHK